MFCVIQEIQRKRPNKGGAYREYEVTSNTLNINGKSSTRYAYYPCYDAGRFERPHQEAYRISIHESHRENGRVQKKQCVVGTIGYYALIEWGLYDYVERGVNQAAELFGADFDTLYALVEAKVEPIKKRITAEYHSTEEYKARRQQEKIQKAYQKAKDSFGKKYDIRPEEYDYCYNALGELMNEAYLNQIIRQYQQKQESYRSYRRTNYSNYDFGGSGVSLSRTYTEPETAILKQFYRTLSKSYHPDLNRDRDTTEEMKLLNRLKESWGV